MHKGSGPSLQGPSSLQRVVTLALSFVVLFGPFYCYDLPAANLTELKDHFNVPQTVNEAAKDRKGPVLERFNVLYGLLYSLFSIPNTVLPMVSGCLVDLCGIPMLTVILATTCLVGQAAFAAGTSSQNWALMLTGRAIFGVGAESLYITQTAILATWFDESSMSFALSVLLVATRMSSVANSLVAPAVGSAVTAFDIGCAVCGVAWVAAVFIALHHAAFERRLSECTDSSSRIRHGSRRRIMRMNVLEDLADTGAAPSSCGCSCERSCRCHIPHLSVPPSPKCDLDMYHAILESQPSNTDVLSPYRVDQSPSVRHKRSLHARLKRVIANVKELPLSVWAISLVCCFGFCAVSCLSNIAPAYLTHLQRSSAHKDSQEVVNLKFASMNFTVVLLSPFAGWIVDKTRAYFGVMALGLAVSLSALVTSSFDTSINPVILFIVTSAGQACFAAAIWPTIPLVVPKAATGTAYGLLVSLQNIGLAAGAASVAAVQPPQCNNTFMCSFLILSCCAAVSLLGTLVSKVLMATDRHRSGSGQRLLPTPDSRESVALYSPIEEVSTT